VGEIVEKLAKFLNEKQGRRILDVGTGAGNFISLIKSVYANYEEIIGIDYLEIAVSSAQKNFIEDDKVSFKVMDALQMDFPDESFDIVCLSNSLHHLVNVHAILQEMERVLKPGGYILIGEMINNDLDARQISHLKLHHFAAKLDRIKGDVHNDTYSDIEIIEILRKESTLDLSDSWRLEYQRSPGNSDEEIEYYINVLDQLVSRVIDPMKKKELQKEADEIKDYIKKNGLDGCTTLIVVMKK